MTLIWASRQMFSAAASLGTMARAAGVSIAAPDATKSFCISTTIMAVFFTSITSTCMTCLPCVVKRSRYAARCSAKHVVLSDWTRPFLSVRVLGEKYNVLEDGKLDCWVTICGPNRDDLPTELQRALS